MAPKSKEAEKDKLTRIALVSDDKVGPLLTSLNETREKSFFSFEHRSKEHDEYKCHTS